MCSPCSFHGHSSKENDATPTIVFIPHQKLIRQIYSIYVITNKANWKKYVGYTVQSPEVRLSQHLADAHNGDPRPLYCVIRKYGWENFSFEVVYQSLDKDHCLEEMEPFFIIQHRSRTTQWGYNIRAGGQICVWAEMNGDKIRERLRGSTLSSARRQRISESCKAKWRNSEHRQKCLDACRSPGYREKHSHTSRALWQDADYRAKTMSGLQPVVAKLIDGNCANWEITFPDGSIQVVRNLNEFCRQYDLNSAVMSKAASGKYRNKSYRGFRCRKLL